MTVVEGDDLRVLCVGDRWFPTHPGGLDRYVHEFASAAARRADCTVELCGLDIPSSTQAPAATPTPHGIPGVVEHQTTRQPLLTSLGAADTPLTRRVAVARRAFARRRLTVPDAINLHFAPTAVGLLDRLPGGVPVTFTFHGPWALESARERPGRVGAAIRHTIERLVHRRSDRFIVLSSAFGAILRDRYGVDSDRIHVVPGAVDVGRFVADTTRDAARAALGWPRDRFVVFSPRRLVHRVGVDVLLDAMVTARRRHGDLWLAIAGRGPQQAALRQHAARLGLADHVRFLGFVPDDDLVTAYQAADVTVVPSQSLEGFGLVVVESLACGTPVIATPVGGLPEVLAPLAADLVTPAPHASALATHLSAAVDGGLSLPSRAECRRYAVARHDWTSIAGDVLAVLTGHGHSVRQRFYAQRPVGAPA